MFGMSTKSCTAWMHKESGEYEGTLPAKFGTRTLRGRGNFSLIESTLALGIENMERAGWRKANSILLVDTLTSCWFLKGDKGGSMVSILSPWVNPNEVGGSWRN